MKLTKNNIAIIASDNCICKWVAEEGRLDHDQNLLPIVLQYINEGDTVIDCGAFIGDHTIAYSNKVGDDGLIIAFEPSKEAYECLEYNLKEKDNTIIRKQGLGEKTESKGIRAVEGNSGMNYLIEGNEISIMSIDELNLSKLDFIKIDCEGYELNVLKGGINTINKFKPKMLIEINDMTLERSGMKRKDIFNFLDSINYSYSNIYKSQGLKEYQMDVICLPR
jgi:FkbM family methyltransferase